MQIFTQDNHDNPTRQILPSFSRERPPLRKAEAGIQSNNLHRRHSRAGGNPVRHDRAPRDNFSENKKLFFYWVPAFAGMTAETRNNDDDRNDERKSNTPKSYPQRYFKLPFSIPEMLQKHNSLSQKPFTYRR